MRLITVVIAVLLVLIQYPLWLGKGGWFKVWELEQKLTTQNRINDSLKDRNLRLEGEVKDLREGRGAIEERARYELGMVKEGEVFVQILEGVQAAKPVKPTTEATQPAGDMSSSAPPMAATNTPPRTRKPENQAAGTAPALPALAPLPVTTP